MGITTEQYERIIRFLDAKMDLQEMDLFEKELSVNPEMREQLDFEQSIRDNFATHKIGSLTGSQPVTSGKVINGWKWWAAASVVAVIVLTFVATLWPKPMENQEFVVVKLPDSTQFKSTPPQASTKVQTGDSIKANDLTLLFKKYYKKDEIPDHVPIYLADALLDYESGNYKTLQRLNLNDLPQTRGINEMSDREVNLVMGHYYKALAFLETGNTKEAIINLDEVLNHKTHGFLRTKTQWYLALSYLKENNGEKAAALCTTIINNGESKFFAEQAKKILETLRK